MTNVVPLRRPVYGATPEEWAHFALVLGPSDLLPVVSNPQARISHNSTLKGLGKTPSTYNGSREVVGFPKWTQVQATSRMVERWAQESDHGICVQTRRVRALDVDVDDADLAERVGAAFHEALGLAQDDVLPCRARAGTGKRLLAFELVGRFPKRSFKVVDGLVEFLANGQQFIAVGTHPSGSRYEWQGGLPYTFPVVTQEAFERAWAAIVEEFALEGVREGGEVADRSRADITGVEDPVADFIYDQGLALGAQDEKVFVTCPWIEGHSSDSGISQTAWLVAGTRGFQRGHFQCMHASCSGRADEDFLDAIGYRIADFEDLDAVAAGGGSDNASVGSDDSEPQPWPRLKRRPKTGLILPSLGNLEKVLARPDIVGCTLLYDEFRDELLIDGRPFVDADAVSLRINLEGLGFEPIGKEAMRDALLVHARDNTFDSAKDWLTSLPPWDGVERVAGSFSRYFAAAPSSYTEAVGRYAWTAMAGRVMEPGCKADMAVILQGSQGLRKSSAVAALVPDRGWFRELSLHSLDADLSRKLRGCVVGELAELRGLRSRDSEAIKAWIVQQEERWTPKWQERETAFPRRAVLWGTSNPADILDDATGERRWLPVECLGTLDVDGLIADRDQLWAEALVRWSMLGIEWQDAERMAPAEHVKFKVRDTWAGIIERWMDEPIDVSNETPNERGWVRMEDVLRLALGLEVRGLTQAHERRAGAVLRLLGWKAQGHRVDGKSIWCWVRQV